MKKGDSFTTYITSGIMDSDKIEYFSSAQELVEDLRKNRYY